MLSSLVLMVMLPPSPSLVEPITTVALIWASSPMSMVSASMVIEPGLPPPLVSVIRLVLWSSFRLLASILIVPAFPVSSVLAWSLLLLVSRMFWSVSKVMLPALPSLLVILRMLVLSRLMLPMLLMLTFPAGFSPLVSLSMVTLLRLRLPELMMETEPDWPSVAPTSTSIVLDSLSFILTCLLVIMDKSLSSRFPCG